MQRARMPLLQDWRIVLLLIPTLVGGGLFLYTPIEHKISPIQWIGFSLLLIVFFGIAVYRKEENRIQISAAQPNTCNFDLKGGQRTKRIEGYYYLFHITLCLMMSLVQAQSGGVLKWHFLLLSLLFVILGASTYFFERNEAVVRLQLLEGQIQFYDGTWTEIPYLEITEIKETSTVIKITSLYHSKIHIRLQDFKLEEIDEFKEKLGCLLTFWKPSQTFQNTWPSLSQLGPNP